MRKEINEMIIKNRKNYMIALAVSVVGTIVYFLGGAIIDIGIWEIVLIAAIVASIMCGSLSVYVSLIKASFSNKGGGLTIFSLPFIIFKWMWKLLLIFFAITIGLVLLIGFPGVYAIIAYFKFRDELED